MTLQVTPGGECPATSGKPRGGDAQEVLLLLLPAAKSWMHFQFFQRVDGHGEGKIHLKAPGWINPIPTTPPIIFPNQHKGPKTTRCSLLSAHFQARFSQILGGVQEIKCYQQHREAKSIFPPPPPHRGDPRPAIQAAPPKPGSHQWLRNPFPFPSSQCQAAGGAEFLCAPQFKP